MDDPRQPAQGGVAAEALGDQLLEGAAPLLVLVRILGSGRVEAGGGVSLLHAGHLLPGHEEDLRLGVEEPPDQPGGRGAVDVDLTAGYPLHDVSFSGTGGREGSASAAQRVPAAPRPAATKKVRLGRIVQSAPPIAAAPATAKPRIE